MLSTPKTECLHYGTSYLLDRYHVHLNNHRAQSEIIVFLIYTVLY